jgi:hypothetical protein
VQARQNAEATQIMICYALLHTREETDTQRQRQQEQKFKELQEQLIHLQEQLQQAQQERDEKEVCQRFCGSSCAITCLFAKVS